MAWRAVGFVSCSLHCVFTAVRSCAGDAFSPNGSAQTSGAPWARRTARLGHIVHHLALALDGRPAASFSHRLMMPLSNDTLLRVVRRCGSPGFEPPLVDGIDDWAWRRNQRYGTTICDLERRHGIVTQPRACGPTDRPIAKRMQKISYAGYRFPPEIIQQAIWLYFQFTLSLRDVEDLLAQRGGVSYETVRRWVNHFGPMIAADLRKRRM